jgi:DNA-binding transcriptional ArsR family regulator
VRAACTITKTRSHIHERAATGLSQSNASGHLACLRECGLVDSRQEWRHVYYRLSDPHVEQLLADADLVLEQVAERIEACKREAVEPLAVTAERRAYLRRALRLIGRTGAIGAGVLASSIALVGFGVDSFIEVLSALVMVWRLRAESSGHLPNEEAEKRAIKLIAVTFFILAAYVIFESVRDLLTGEKAETSIVGLILTAVSLVVMPVLAYNTALA